MQLFAKGVIDSIKATFRRWRRVGSEIVSPTSLSGWGYEVAMSGDGTVIAVTFFERNNAALDYLRVYKINADGSISQLGQTLQTDTAYNSDFGRASALNFDGSRIAISSPKFNSNTSQTGRIAIYDLVNGQWVLNATFLGITATASNNHGISFNDSGSRVAFLVAKNNGFFPSVDSFQVFDFNGTSWNQVGQTYSTPFFSKSLQSSILNASGNLLALDRRILELQNNQWVILKEFPQEGGNNSATPCLTTINAVGDKAAILYWFGQSGSESIGYFFQRTYHKIGNDWILKNEGALDSYYGYFQQSGGNPPISFFVPGEGFHRLSSDGNRMMVCQNYVDPNQVVPVGGRSLVTIRVYINDWVNDTWVRQTQGFFSKNGEITFHGAADMSKDGKAFVIGKFLDPTINLPFSRYGIVEVFRKELD